LPVLSLTIDPVLLDNRHSGIYVYALERGRKWQRPAQVEYFEPNNAAALRFPVQLRIHGNWSRRFDKKSFHITFPAERLNGRDSAEILRAPGAHSGERSVLVRAAAMDASYRLGDELFRSLYSGAGGLVSRASLAMLLINGKPWGLYNLHEKIDEFYLERRYGAGPYDLIKYDRTAGPVAGEPRHWKELMDFFARHDFTSAAALHLAERQIDIANFTDYWLFNIYAANLDWPHSNAYAFRRTEAAARWRWIAWDADMTFESERGLKHNTLAWATRGELRPDLSYAGTKDDAQEFLPSTLILRSLLQNRSYREQFVSRFCELMSAHFLPDHVAARFDEILEHMTPHLGLDWARWPNSRENYHSSVAGVRRFIEQRPKIVLGHFQQKFKFNDCRADPSAPRPAPVSARR
jgi:hypothetical protein